MMRPFVVHAPYELSVTRSGAGTGTVVSSPAGISCGTDCAEPFNFGTQVTLTATAAAGNAFTGWSGACTGSGPCVVTVENALSATANFEPVCAAPTSFSVPASSTNGSVRLAWSKSATAGVTYVLMENGTPIYTGSDLTYTVYGRGSGSFSYTLKATRSGYLDSAIIGPYTTNVALACSPVTSFYPPVTSTSDTYRLAWSKSGTPGVDYVLTENGVEIYRGQSLYYYVSGRGNGSYVYALRAVKADYADSPEKGGTTTVTLTCGNISSFFPPATGKVGSYKFAWSRSGTPGVDYVLTENGTEIYRGPNLYHYVTWSAPGSYTYTLRAVRSGYLDSGVKTGTTGVSP
jgi:hypothetical protein